MLINTQDVWTGFSCLIYLCVCVCLCSLLLLWQPLYDLSQSKQLWIHIVSAPLRVAISLRVHALSVKLSCLCECKSFSETQSLCPRTDFILSLCCCFSPGKPDPERPLPGRVQVHSEDDREGYSGHWPGPVHEVGTKRQAQMEIWLERVREVEDRRSQSQFGGRGKRREAVSEPFFFWTGHDYIQSRNCCNLCLYHF